MSRRMERVNDLLRDELAELLSRQLKDPRLSPLVSITHVETSADLSHAKVFVSVMAEPERQKEVLRALDSAAGYLRRALWGRLSLKRVPALHFLLDNSIARGARLSAYIDRVLAGENPQTTDEEGKGLG